MKKAFQFRIYPNKNQEVKLNRTRSACASKNIENRAVGTDCAELTPVESMQEQLVEAGSPVL